jgi:small-conductance mechanosensitive channel
MIERFTSLAIFDRAPNGVGDGAEPPVMKLAGGVSSLWERIAGAFQQVEEAVFFSEIWPYEATPAVVLLLVLVLHVAIFSFLRRKIERRRREKGQEDARVLILEALGKPLKLAIWVCGIYLSALPLLMFLQPEHRLFPLRLLVEKILGLGLFIALYWFLYRSVHAGEVLLRRWAGAPQGSFQDLVIQLIGKTLRVVIPVAAVIAGLQLVELSPAFDTVIAKSSSLLIIGAISWMLFQVVDLGERFVITQYGVTVGDNLRARQIYTQVHILKKTLYVIIAIFSVASALMLFEQVRGLGTSVLASAGVLGIVIGFAAQRTIANLFAGFQLALTQPIRIDDVVIVQNEWGRIEEITLTYVVVRVWDLRRLIVPLSYFIEHPFQNWTWRQADILGTVFIYNDYTIPVEAIREELKRIVAKSNDWDGKVCVLQVTNATERSLELRALASASDASKAWSLRCEIREKLVAFVQKNYPASLPRVRAELQSDGRVIFENPF